MSEITKLELTWIGKDQKISPEPRILLERKDLHYGDPNNGNMLIYGDNLLALKSLEQKFAGKIKCIYIDPPYNTGAAFTHYDDNLEHSIWLGLIKPRLEILKKLLAKDGSIWISIDDDEHAYMKVLCDEIFGRSSFVASIVWQKRTSPDMRLAISTAHDYILVYARDKEEFKKVVNKLPLTKEQEGNYKNPDKDPRGLWISTDCTAQAGHGTKDQFYSVTTPSGRVIELPSDRCWRFTKRRMQEEIDAGRIWFGVDGNGVPRKKTYLSESEGVSAWTWWTNKEVGHNQEAKKEVIAFNSTDVFSTPKPERLIERIIALAANNGDLVLDSFLGSGTTSAVAHKMGRRWIGIEMGEHAFTHCKVRLDKVIDGEQGGISKNVGWTGGGGYRFFELAPSLINKDQMGIDVISHQYNADMLASAMCLHKGYKYLPSSDVFFKQGKRGDKNFIFTTTNLLTVQMLDYIKGELGDNEHLLVCASSFTQGLDKRHKNIIVQKIPDIILGKCEFGKDNYNFNIVENVEVDDE